MVEIQITGGIAIVDDEDAQKVQEYAWHTNKDGYAVTNIKRGNGRTSISMHRMIMGCVSKDGKELDLLS